MGDLSAHFSRSEFACPHCGCGTVSPQLLSILEDVRARAGGRPIKPVSGFRCRPHNDAIGGALRSRHMYGDAVDIPAGAVPISVARASSAVGIGRSRDGKWALHVDWRPGHRVEWQY